MFAMMGTSVAPMISVFPAEVLTSPVAKGRSAEKVMSVERMEYVTDVGPTSLVQAISATRVTIMTIPMESAINTAI